MINYKSTSPKYNPKIPLKADRPKCTQPRCNEPRVISGTQQTGDPLYYPRCRTHHNEKYYSGKSTVRVTAEKIGLSPSQYVERAAMLRGFSSNLDYMKWRKQNPLPVRAVVDETAVRLQQIRSRAKV